MGTQDSSLFDSSRVRQFEVVIDVLHAGSPEEQAMQTALDLLHFALKHEIDFRSIFEAAQGVYIDGLTRDRQIQLETKGK